MRPFPVFAVFALLFLLAFTADGQNLVANGSFEEVVCSPHPEYPNSLFSAHPWYSPASGTPDLYGNAPAEAGCWQTDYTAPAYLDLGEQAVAHEGTRMAGLYVHGSDVFCIREYLQVELVAPLVAGEKYCVRLYAALSASSVLATDGLGVLFTGMPEIAAQAACLPYTQPHVRATMGAPITSRDWVLIEGDFVATGGEQYMTLGCFDDPADLTFESVEGYSLNEVAYYYIDDVHVEQCEITTGVARSVQPMPHVVYLPESQRVQCFVVFGGWMRVYDMSGRTVLETASLPAGSHSVVLGSLPAGVYIVHLKDGGAVHQTRLVR